MEKTSKVSSHHKAKKIDGVEVGSLGGFEGKKGKGESDAILFYLKMYLYIKI